MAWGSLTGFGCFLLGAVRPAQAWLCLGNLGHACKGSGQRREQLLAYLVSSCAAAVGRASAAAGQTGSEWGAPRVQSGFTSSYSSKGHGNRWQHMLICTVGHLLGLLCQRSA